MVPDIPQEDLYEQLVAEMRGRIEALPVESAGLRERRGLIDAVSAPAYWLQIDNAKARVLNLEVAPLMRYLPGTDLAALTYDIHCLEALRALLDGDGPAASGAAARMRDDIIRLPLGHPDVEPVADEIRARYDQRWCDRLTVDEVLGLRARFGGLMRFRQNEPDVLISLDLADVFEEQRWIEVGPKGVRFELSEYQRKVEEFVRPLAESNPVFGKIAAGGELTDGEVDSAHSVLAGPDIFADEPTLQKAWRAPHASSLTIVRHILGVEHLVAREDALQAAVSSYLATKNFLLADQLTLIRLVARRVIDAGHIDPEDLLDPPFTTVTLDAEELLGASNLAELLAIVRQFEVR